MPDDTPTPPPAESAAIDPRYEGAHERDVLMDQAGQELWVLIAEWRAKWGPTRVEYLWVFQQVLAMELRAAGRDERDALDGKKV